MTIKKKTKNILVIAHFKKNTYIFSSSNINNVLNRTIYNSQSNESTNLNKTIFNVLVCDDTYNMGTLINIKNGKCENIIKKTIF